MSMKKYSNQGSGSVKPRFIKTRSEHNQSFDSCGRAPPQRLKSYSQQQPSNILDDLEEEFPKTIHVNLKRQSAAEQSLQTELSRMLQRVSQGDKMRTEDLSSIISVLDQCMHESVLHLKEKDYEVLISLYQIQNIRQQYEQQIHSQQSTIMALEDEVQELRQMLEKGHGYKVQQLEQENEMLKMQNQQAIKLAVQGRTKKQERELGDFVNKSVNNYSILLNQQYNKIYPKKSLKVDANLKFAYQCQIIRQLHASITSSCAFQKLYSQLHWIL